MAGVDLGSRQYRWPKVKCHLRRLSDRENILVRLFLLRAEGTGEKIADQRKCCLSKVPAGNRSIRYKLQKSL